ncbi:MAG: winged helix-turn-helix domain-containing protein [Euryarchaeota archaeon]|nr:winged helix-turn-helix domain-containing protein [Euryarchaeota archaeon]
MDRPYNANQLANAMKMDYKTVRHHLDVLIKNGIITMNIERNRGLYFISKSIESNLNYFNNI